MTVSTLEKRLEQWCPPTTADAPLPWRRCEIVRPRHRVECNVLNSLAPADAANIRGLRPVGPDSATPSAARQPETGDAARGTSPHSRPGAQELRAWLQEVGVREDLAGPLAALSLAVATVHGAGHLLPEPIDGGIDQQPGAKAPDETTARESGRPSRKRRSSRHPHQVEAPGVKARATQLLAAVEAISTTAAQVEAVLVTAAAELTQMTGRLLLAEKGAHSPEELTSDQRDRWRARAKRVTRHEIEAVTGWGAGESMDLVALANTPAAITGPVAHALSTGHAPWRLARRHSRACPGLAHEAAAAIANGLFGNHPKAAG